MNTKCDIGLREPTECSDITVTWSNRKNKRLCFPLLWSHDNTAVPACRAMQRRRAAGDMTVLTAQTMLACGWLVTDWGPVTSHQWPLPRHSTHQPQRTFLSHFLSLSQADDSSTDIMMFCPLASYRAQCFFEPILSCAGLALVVHERHQINIHIYIYNMIYITYHII